MITGFVIAAAAIGAGTWLRWVSRPAVISVRTVLDLDQFMGRPAQPQPSAQLHRAR